MLTFPGTASALLMLISASPLLAQTTDTTGCYFEPGSDLRRCLGSYVSEPPIAPTGLVAAQEAAYYCTMYQQMADCWGVGTYCREWLPLQIAAVKLCRLANGTTLAVNATTNSTSTISAPTLLTTIPPIGPFPLPTRNLTASLGSLSSFAIETSTPTPTISVNATALSSVLSEASNVITSIWNNDSGTDIPSITDESATSTLPTWTKITTATAPIVIDPFVTSPSSDAAASVIPPLLETRQEQPPVTSKIAQNGSVRSFVQASETVLLGVASGACLSLYSLSL